MNLIPMQEFVSNPLSLFDRGWFLLTSGDYTSGRFNTMTISWGSLGTLWNKPVAQVFVRPTRHTFSFMESSPDFSLCAFPAEYRSALQMLGTQSGRDSNKLANTSLTPVGGDLIHSPVFAEATLILECRKIYADDLDPDQFKDPAVLGHYPERDFHRMYIGEILQVRGDPAVFG